MPGERFADRPPDIHGVPPDSEGWRSSYGKLGSTAFFALTMVVVLITSALTFFEVHRLNNPPMPAIPGASREEQASEPVRAGYARGLECRRLLMATWGASWGAAAQDERDRAPWPEVLDRWSRGDQSRRDDPILRLYSRDLSLYFPTDGRSPTESEARAGYLFTAAFSAAFTSPARP